MQRKSNRPPAKPLLKFEYSNELASMVIVGLYLRQCLQMGTPMTTRKKRLQITIEPELDPVLDRLSALMEKPKATLVTDLLMSSLSVLIQTADVLEQAKQVKDGLADMETFRQKLISDAHSQIDVIGESLDQKPE